LIVEQKEWEECQVIISSETSVCITPAINYHEEVGM